MRNVTTLVTAIFITGCTGAAPTPGANPHDMSAADHDSHAHHQEAVAAGHGGEYEPSVEGLRQRCRSDSKGLSDVCWSDVVNPTEEHLREAEHHRKMAADHRAGAAALRDAETAACAGIADADRDISPFAHRLDISAAEVLPAASPNRPPRGALVTFRAVPGLTQQRLQSQIDCHIARNAALGHDLSTMAYCPLVPRHVRAVVSTTAEGNLRVTIDSEDDVSANEIANRAERLSGRLH